MKLGAFLLGLAGLMTQSLHAGEVLRLKSGDLKIQDDRAKLALAGVQSHFVFQFAQPIHQSDRAALESKGFVILRYLPDDALIVEGNSSRFDGIPGVRAITAFKPEWKIDSALALSAASGSTETLRVSVRVLSENDLEWAAYQAKSYGNVLEASGQAIVVDVEARLASKLAEIDGVEWVELMPEFQTMDFKVDGVKADDHPAITGYESGTKVMGFDKAYERGFTGEGQIAAMSDTGCDLGDVSKLHPDLADVIKGYAMGVWVESWADPMGHGTHVSGSVVGNGKSSDGKIRGGAFGAKFLPTGMWSSIFNNLVVENDFEKLMGTPYRDGARVHTNSWGSPTSIGVYDNFAANVDTVMWNHPELLVLFAAGNSGQDADRNGVIDENSIGTPGTAKNVLTVGASENYLLEGGIQKKLKELRDGDKKWGVEPLASDTVSNNAEGMACFSSRGPTADGRIKPEIVAPGTNIVSTRSHTPTAELLWGEWDANYLYSGGTSMATPLAAGAATVLREYLVKTRHLADPSAALVKGALMHTAHDMYPGQYGTGPTQELAKRRPNNHEGYGRVDMDKATSLGEETLIMDETVGVATGDSHEIQLNVAAGEGLRATLSYTDAPAAVNASKTLVNDLDLSVVGPNGTTTLNDHVNNSEMIELSNLSAGTYRVVVRGTNVPQGKSGKQPYALIVSKTR